MSSLLLLTALVAAQPSLPRVTVDARPLVVTATVRELPARPVEEGPEFYPPRRVRVTFGPQQDWRELNVYPVAALLAQYPDSRDRVRGQIDALKGLLRQRAAPNAVRGEWPFLPLAFAAQVLAASVRYVDFDGGRGVRYLVAYRQDAAPLSRDDVYYTFQGLTNDGRHYVSFVYPASLAELPKDAFAPANKSVMDALASGDAQRAKTTWEAYLSRMKRQLDGLTNDARLTRLDTVVKSLLIR
ncbi:hypothetical protein [Deinococcus yavapaiensis]|uniref:Uncharacterized protein n=1 Tax=Deinococcus yavapaiensis KR-236 TaxID=694435 RepID=A0A318SCK2_9DEIO|nr:hypothetical protein [Deinococcus yavapaiensis]PYE54974.1 hypothetical protein DES52_104248 [Deinococcus yavapaiensis KR-236]